MERQERKLSLADSNDILAQFWGGLHKHGGEHLHDGGRKAFDQARAVGCVTLGSTEALALKDGIPWAMVSSFFMNSATRVMMSVQSSQVQSPSTLLTLQRPSCWHASPAPMKAG